MACLLNKTATPVTKSYARNAAGDVVPTEASGTAFACALQPQSQGEELRLDIERRVNSQVLWFKPTTTLAKDDLVIVDSVTYRVRGATRDEGGRGVWSTVTVEERAPVPA